MGWLDLFRGFKDPARAWPAQPNLELQFDFERNALCGVPLRAPWERLSVFGPPDEPRAAADASLWYFQRGFSVDLEKGVVDGFTFVWRDELEQGFSSFAGHFVRGARSIELDGKTSEEKIVEQLGRPYWKDTDDLETLLFYEVHGVEWQFELELADRLKALIVTARPLLADASQRSAYRVTKPWPPAPD
jgi:hypothetical protein